MKRAAVLFALILTFSGCTAIDRVNQPQPLAPYLELAAGKQWVMRDARTEKLTTFMIGPPKQVGSLIGFSFPLRISKTDVDSYWAPGQDRSIDYYLHQDADGTIWSPLSMVFAGNSGRITVLSTITMTESRADEPRVNYILGPLAIAGATVVTHYRYSFNAGDETQVTEGVWKSIYTLEQVDVPAYHGPALCGRYSEGSDTVENNAEQWCFARGVGLVRLTYLFDDRGPNPHTLELVSYR